MNLQNLLTMASKFGIGQDKIQQAMQMSSKYSHDINGLRRVINDNGGTNFIEKALNFANKPLVSAGLAKLGVTPELINGIKRDLGLQNNTSNDDILERLKRLK